MFIAAFVREIHQNIDNQNKDLKMDRADRAPLDIKGIIKRTKGPVPIELDEVSAYSLASKCALIKLLLEKDRMNSNHASELSLFSLSKSFQISNSFYAWQKEKAKSLIRSLKKPENADVLEGFKNWEQISVGDQETGSKSIYN